MPAVQTLKVLVVWTVLVLVLNSAAAQEAPSPSDREQAFERVEKALDQDPNLAPETKDAFRELLQVLRGESGDAPSDPAKTHPAPHEAVDEPGSEAPLVSGSSLTDKLDIRGLAYLRYSYELEDSSLPGLNSSTDDRNEFDVDRIYLTFDWQLWDKAKVSYTLEGGEFRDESGQFDLTTKAFFLEIRDLLYPSTYLWIGQADLPWVPYEEGLWGYRYQGTVFPDRMGYMTSTDLGVGFGGDIPKDYGSWQASIVNGEGWNKNEIGKHKNVHGRLTLNPLAGREGPMRNFFLTGFGAVGKYDDVLVGPDDRERFIGQIGYKSPQRWTLVSEYFEARDAAEKMAVKFPSLEQRIGRASRAQGFSTFGTLNLGVFKDTDFARKWELMGRWDHLNPDDKISNNDLDLWIAGVSYRWNRNIQVLLNHEAIDYEKRALLEDESRIMLQALLEF